MPEVIVALPASISSSSLAIPKVSDLCPEGSRQQYIAGSEVQMVYAKGVDVPMQHTDRQLQYRATQIHYAQNTKTWPTN